MEAWHGITAALAWLATLTAALHLRQPRDVRSWWRTGSRTIQFLVLLSLTVSALVPPAPTTRGRVVLILIGLLPLLLLAEILWRRRAVCFRPCDVGYKPFAAVDRSPTCTGSLEEIPVLISRSLSSFLLSAVVTGGAIAAPLSAAESARPAEMSIAGQLRRAATFFKAQGLPDVAMWLDARGNDLEAVVAKQLQSIAEESRRLQSQADALSRLTGAPTRVEVEVRTVEFDLLKLDTPEGAAFLKEQKIPVPADPALLGKEVTRVAVASKSFLFAAVQKGFARQVGCPSVVTRLGEESTVHMGELPSPAAVEQDMRIGITLSAKLVRAEKDRVAVEVKHSISSENGSTVPLAGGGVSPVLDISSARTTLTMVPGTPLVLGGMGKSSTTRFRPPGSDPDDPAAEQVFESSTLELMIVNVTRAE